jgi:cyanophycinase
VGPEKGSLIIIGGGHVGQEIMDEFIRRAGGEDARIVIIPTATDDTYMEKENAIREIEAHFRGYGMEHLTVLHTRDSAVANQEAFIAPLKEATGIYFPGGRQWRIADGFLHTRAHEEMFKLLERGGVIGGSSAGATIQGSYLARGDTKNNQIMMGDYEEGLGFLRNVAIDQHVLARNRQFDMFDILKNRPELLGIGIDESTAIVVERDTFQVMGESYVLIYDRSFWSREGSELKSLPPPGKQFYMLRPGDRYDLAERTVIQ